MPMPKNVVTDDLVKKRFWEKVPKGLAPDICWEWTGNRAKNGYGRLTVRPFNETAHRLSYIIHNGDLPQFSGAHGACVCHKCDNRACVNPNHLFVGTQADNLKDRDQKGRNVIGQKRSQSKLTNEDVRAIRASNDPQRAIAAAFGVTQAVVSGIKLGKRWTHVI